MQNINNNIQENYVSFENAKLLKEKGFNTETEGKLYSRATDGIRINELSDDEYRKIIAYGEVGKDIIEYMLPTTALAIKWIRVNYGISIFIDNTNRIYYCTKKEKNNINVIRNKLLTQSETMESEENEVIFNVLNNMCCQI